LPVREGAVVAQDGREVGTHRGTPLYTVGQRSGFGSLKEAGPWYVTRVDAAANMLVVGRKEDLAVREVDLVEATFIDGTPSGPLVCEARLRYHAPSISAVYEAGRLTLDEPFFGAAPGQAAVLYSGSRVLGGGIIAGAA
jgi:tRNA-specific 2-thiouridylase